MLSILEIMDQREKTRGHRCAANFGIAIAVLYIVLTTICMVSLYRIVISQTARIQSLETVAGTLAARVYKLESSFTAQKSHGRSAGETEGVLEEKSKQLKTKVRLIAVIRGAIFTLSQLISYSKIVMNL